MVSTHDLGYNVFETAFVWYCYETLTNFGKQFLGERLERVPSEQANFLWTLDNNTFTTSIDPFLYQVCKLCTNYNVYKDKWTDRERERESGRGERPA